LCDQPFPLYSFATASRENSRKSSLYMVGKILGHSQVSTTQRYAHLRDDPFKAVADRTGAKIAEAMRVDAARGRAGIMKR